MRLEFLLFPAFSALKILTDLNPFSISADLLSNKNLYHYLLMNEYQDQMFRRYEGVTEEDIKKMLRINPNVFNALNPIH